MMKAVFLMLLPLALSATLVSRTVHKELTNTLSARAGLLSGAEQACVLREARAFGPTMKDGRKMYDVVRFREHVIDGMKKCVGKSAGSYGKEHADGICGCRSGCHFCCAAVGIGAAGLCFDQFCPGVRCLGQAVCED